MDSNDMSSDSTILERLINTDLPAEGGSVELNSIGYSMSNGILRQDLLLKDVQKQMSSFYEYHWKLPGAYDSEASDDFQKTVFRSMFPGYEEKVPKWVKSESTVLDIGCGSGMAGRCYFNGLFDRLTYVGVDMSRAIDQAKVEFDALGINVGLLQSELNNLPFPSNTFDFVFCPGVLHYTLDMAEAFKAISDQLKVGGRLVTWIYKKQPPLREFTDGFISKAISSMPPEEALKAVEPLTKLGCALGDLNQEIEIPEDIPILGIPAGKHDLQRLFYYYVVKLFYNPDLPFTRANLANFNAYYPQHILFSDPSDVETYCEDSGLRIEEMYTEGNGISIIAIKI